MQKQCFLATTTLKLKSNEKIRQNTYRLLFTSAVRLLPLMNRLIHQHITVICNTISWQFITITTDSMGDHYYFFVIMVCFCMINILYKCIQKRLLVEYLHFQVGNIQGAVTNLQTTPFPESFNICTKAVCVLKLILLLSGSSMRTLLMVFCVIYSSWLLFT